MIEETTLKLTDQDDLIVSYDTGDVYGNEWHSFGVKDARSGKVTHIGSEALIPVITDSSPNMPTREVMSQSIEILQEVLEWLDTCDSPQEEENEHDAHMDIKEAMLERSAS